MYTTNVFFSSLFVCLHNPNARICSVCMLVELVLVLVGFLFPDINFAYASRTFMYMNKETERARERERETETKTHEVSPYAEIQAYLRNSIQTCCEGKHTERERGKKDVTILVVYSCRTCEVI